MMSWIQVCRTTCKTGAKSRDELVLLLACTIDRVLNPHDRVTSHWNLKSCGLQRCES